MKKIVFTFSLLISLTLSAQVFEIKPSYGYQFGSKLNYGPNYIKVEDSDQFGITAGFEVFDNFVAELTYTRMSTELRIRDVFIAPSETYLADLNADWFFLGSTRYIQTEVVKPFFGGGLGFVVITPGNENQDLAEPGTNFRLSNSTRFAFSFKGGVNIMFTESIGFNIQGNLYFPVNWGGVYVSPGGVAVSTGSTVILGGFSGGLVFRLGS